MRDVLLVFVGTLLAVLCWTWPNPGRPSQGRIIIDDTHSAEWAQAARQLDREYFGDFSTYSYSALAEHLSQCAAVTVLAGSANLSEALSNCDVLVLKTPQIDYTPSELLAIQQWVFQGGGLIALGDHTDLFDMNSRLNLVLSPMGLRLNADSVRAANNEFFVEAKTPIFNRHPVLAHIDRVGFMTGCSVTTEHRSQVALAANNAICDPADYLNPSRFPSWSNDGTLSHGCVPVVAAASYGTGRVVVWSDSTVFSSFEYHKQGYDRVFLSMLAWVGRSDSEFRVRWVAFALAIASLALLAIRSMRLCRWTVFAVFLGSYSGMYLTTRIGQVAYPVIEPFVSLPSIAFVREGTWAIYPPSLGVAPGAEPKAMFDTLCNVPLRLGRRSWIADSIPHAVRESVSAGSSIVLVNLISRIDGSSLEDLAGWVSSGGHLVLIQRSESYLTEGTRQLCEALGLTMTTGARNEPQIVGSVQTPTPAEVAMFEAQYGTGRFTILVSDDKFSNASLGHSMAVPDASQRELFDILYRVFAVPTGRQDFVRVDVGRPE